MEQFQRLNREFDQSVRCDSLNTTEVHPWSGIFKHSGMNRSTVTIRSTETTRTQARWHAYTRITDVYDSASTHTPVTVTFSVTAYAAEPFQRARSDGRTPSLGQLCSWLVTIWFVLLRHFMAPPAVMMVRAAIVAVLLMQCCNVILAARPLLDAGGDDDGRWLGQGGAGSLIMQVLKGPCHSGGWHNPNHHGCP